jgi:hypothetical protein
MKDYLPLNNLAARQYIDARQTFFALREAQVLAKQVRGGMYWHRQSDSLIRTSALGAEKSLGKRSAETEKIYLDFTARKAASTERVRSLKAQLKIHERLNKALYVGRLDPLVTALINRLDTAGVAESFHVVGTHALYAYEAAAGVHLDSGVVATRDIDLLWDVRKRMHFWTQMARIGSTFLALLKKVDDSFTLRRGQPYTAVNKEGFEVDILRRMVEADDPHPVQLGRKTRGEQALTEPDDQEDFSVVQALRAGILLDKPTFVALIVDRNGGMALMRTIAPQVFVDFKQWLATLPAREPIKRRRDAAQASVVADLIRDEKLSSI